MIYLLLIIGVGAWEVQHGIISLHDFAAVCFAAVIAVWLADQLSQQNERVVKAIESSRRGDDGRRSTLPDHARVSVRAGLAQTRKSARR